MVKPDDIRWLAGYLEGEGSFTINNRTPIIALVTTDEDVAERVSNIMGQGVRGPYKYGSNRKPFWRVQTGGAKAVGWMMTLYVLMGIRRKEQIKHVISTWKEIKPTNSSRTRNRNGFPALSGL